jgi:formylglycine-generating enzyme required for sulfatase activity
MKKLAALTLLTTAVFLNAQVISSQTIDINSLVYVNGGVFTMGSPVGEPGRSSQEAQRQVTLDSFYLSRHEITQAQYLEIMGVNPSHFKGNSLPVEQVTWFNAVEFCNRLSEGEGLTPAYTINGNNVTWNRSANGYRLPTEAEWEYACRSGTQTAFFYGDNITSSHANFNGSRPYNNNARSSYRQITVSAGSFQPNSFGLYDMHGNVAEWCWDWHGEYARGEQVNPAGAASGGYKVFRGGGWNHSADFLRCAHRSALVPSNRGHYLGFRIARNAD